MWLGKEGRKEGIIYGILNASWKIVPWWSMVNHSWVIDGYLLNLFSQLGSHRMTLTVASFLPLCPPLEAERQRERKGGRESKSGSSKQPPDQRFVPGGGRSADHLFRNVVSLIGSRFPSEINSRAIRSMDRTFGISISFAGSLLCPLIS
jgi:hypothetical protein